MMQKPPSHEPRHPLQDDLYYPLADYLMFRRMKVRGPISQRRMGEARRRCLAIIRRIKETR